MNEFYDKKFLKFARQNRAAANISKICPHKIRQRHGLSARFPTLL